MPFRFPLIALAKPPRCVDVPATQRTGKPRFETDDVNAFEEYNP